MRPADTKYKKLRRAKLIINPTAGKSKGKMPPLLKWTFDRLQKRVDDIPMPELTAAQIIHEVRAVCAKEGIILNVSFTKYPNHAAELAKKSADSDIVIVAGGDGTTNEVINGLMQANGKASTTLAIIPFGSTNVLALELNIPFDIKESAQLITDGKHITIDLGFAKTRQKERYFSMMMSVGFDASLIKRISPEFKKKWKGLAYPLAGIQHLFDYKWRLMQVKHRDDRTNDSVGSTVESKGYFAMISNSKDYAGEYQIADKASLHDGLLDLVIINRKKWWQIAGIIFTFFIGKSNKFFRGEYVQVKSATIDAKYNMHVQADGETIGTVPVSVKCFPKALRLLVPHKKREPPNRLL